MPTIITIIVIVTILIITVIIINTIIIVNIMMETALATPVPRHTLSSFLHRSQSLHEAGS